MLTLGDSKFSAVEAIGFLTCAIGHAHEDPSFVVFFGRSDETRSWFRSWVDIVRKVAPGDIARRWFWPPTHQVLSISKSVLRTVPPLALGADFLI